MYGDKDTIWSVIVFFVEIRHKTPSLKIGLRDVFCTQFGSSAPSAFSINCLKAMFFGHRPCASLMVYSPEDNTCLLSPGQDQQKDLSVVCRRVYPICVSYYLNWYLA